MVENPSAFPHGAMNDGWVMPSTGMTLRDWFAGQALVMKRGPTGTCMTLPEVAERAYQMADAMLAERAKAGPQ